MTPSRDRVDASGAALEGRRVLVIGLGESGLALARWAHYHGAQITVFDSRPQPPQRAALLKHCPGVRWVLGDWPTDILAHTDLVAWSQGVSPHVGPSGAFYAAAQARALPVWGELEFFARALQAWRAEGYEGRVLAITGTNGKTTTTRLLGHLCAHAGRSVVVAGNISPPVLEALLTAVQTGERPALWVLELASYQLVLSECFAPDVAAILNITQDHLDWHGSLAAYVAAKRRMFAPHTLAVFHRADALTQPPTHTGVGVGLDAPTQAPGYGVVREGGLDWLAEAWPDEEAAPGGRRKRVPRPVRVQALMPTGALPIHGAHNQLNALFALAMARAVGLPIAPLLHALRTFKGEPHRCELVRVLRDVHWYDDSKGTNVGATVAALAGLGRPVVLIAGGDGKGQDFSALAPAVAAHARAVLLIGRDAPAIRTALAQTHVAVEDCLSLEAAVSRAAVLAQAGDAVLLSPACASWDMFRDYTHRADVFIQAVRQQALEAGELC